MIGNFAIGLLCGIFAGLVNGVFLLPMRYTRKWAWENTWLFFTVFSTGLIPCLFAVVAVPHVFSIIRHSPLSFLLPGLVAGCIWGIAQVMYGLGVGILGVAVGSAVISTTSTISGVFGPIIVYAPGRLFSSGSLILLVALLLIVSGIYQYSRAGRRKEKELVGKEAPRQVVSGKFQTGFLICLVCGVLGTAFIYGGKSSTGLVDAARAAGAAPAFAFYIAYMVTFNAGMIPGLIYSIYKLTVNHTAREFLASGCFLWNVGLAFIMGLLWYSGILMYGMGSEKMGRFGPSIAFVLFGGGTILFANLFGWLAGEWKGASRSTVRGFLVGMVLLVAAIVLVAIAMPSLP
jgi:L-rhamnose-H+ transport protein